MSESGSNQNVPNPTGTGSVTSLRFIVFTNQYVRHSFYQKMAYIWRKITFRNFRKCWNSIPADYIGNFLFTAAGTGAATKDVAPRQYILVEFMHFKRHLLLNHDPIHRKLELNKKLTRHEWVYSTLSKQKSALYTVGECSFVRSLTVKI
jgi:hypothetical protein